MSDKFFSRLASAALLVWTVYGIGCACAAFFAVAFENGVKAGRAQACKCGGVECLKK